VLVDAWMNYLRGRGEVTDTERVLMGRLLAEFSTLRNMSLSITAMLARGEKPVVEASIVKDLGSGFEQSIPTLIGDHLAGERENSVPTSLLATLEYVASMCPSFSLRGGTREILRGIIARGLGLR